MEVKVKKEDGDSREMRYLARKYNSEPASKHKAAESMCVGMSVTRKDFPCEGMRRGNEQQ